MTLAVERLDLRGDGVAGGLRIARVLPGEVIEGEPVGGRIDLPRILTPSSDRVAAPCPHFRSCGGCALMHATDGFVAGWKTEVIARALSGQGLTAPIRPILTSPPASRRRATLAGRRTKGGVLVGFHMRGSATILAVPGCHLLHPDLMRALPALQAVVLAGASRTGELAMTLTATATGLDLAVSGGKPADATLRSTLARLAEDHALARLTWEGETVALRAQPVVLLGPARVPLPSGAFLQATGHGEAARVAAGPGAVAGARRIADLFAGCGTFALPLAARAEVHAVEGDAAMIAALDAGWRGAAGLRRVTTEVRDLFRRPLEPPELAHLDAVVLDPPRAGAEAQVARIAAARVPVVAMVSCNPVTFARDARILSAAGYVPEWVQPVDQFRWSPHVELAARFALMDKA